MASWGYVQKLKKNMLAAVVYRCLPKEMAVGPVCMSLGASTSKYRKNFSQAAWYRLEITRLGTNNRIAAGTRTLSAPFENYVALRIQNPIFQGSHILWLVHLFITQYISNRCLFSMIQQTSASLDQMSEINSEGKQPTNHQGRLPKKMPTRSFRDTLKEVPQILMEVSTLERLSDWGPRPSPATASGCEQGRPWRGGAENVDQTR